MFYDYNKCINKNCLFNFIVGERGNGKTYGYKKIALENYFKRKEKFCYIRRTDTELSKAAKTFFEDIGKEYPEYEFKTRTGKDGTFFYIKHGEKEPLELIGFGVSVNVGTKDKSVSYEGVTTICFDEFMGVKYLKDEVNSFLNLYETIARLKDIPVYFLSNAMSISNPYFDYFEVRLPYGKKRYTVSKDQLIYLEICYSEEYRKVKSETRFGQLIKDTDYGHHAIENEFFLDTNSFIKKKNGSSKPILNIAFNSKTYGLWFDRRSGECTLSDDLGSNVPEAAITDDDHKPNRFYVKRGRKIAWLNLMINAYEAGFLYFENQRIKRIGAEILRIIR